MEQTVSNFIRDKSLTNKNLQFSCALEEHLQEIYSKVQIFQKVTYEFWSEGKLTQ